MRIDGPPTKEDILVVKSIIELDSISDRASAVLGFAMVDDELERVARRVMINPKKGHFSSFGFLSSAASKAEALYQFGILD